MNKRIFIIGIIALAAVEIVFLAMRNCGNGRSNNRDEITIGDDSVPDDTSTRSEMTESVEEEGANLSGESEGTDQVDPGVVSYWYGEWISDDEWKRHTDYLTMEKDKGGYILTESIDPNNPRVYVFDKKRGYFIYERDFYGKTLIDEIRFKDKNHLVITKRSGKKAFDDKYRRHLNR